MTAREIASILGVEDQLGEDIIEIPNANRSNFAHWLADFGYTKGVEVGTEYGIHALSLCKANPNLKLVCIDPYETYLEYIDIRDQNLLDEAYEEAKERLAPYNAKIIKGFSSDWVDSFPDESLDFVYLDGNHKLKYILEDLDAWTPKIKEGGIVSGHDYYQPAFNHCDVIQALDIFTKANNISPLFVVGKGRKVKYRNWFFVVE